ncbi:MAG: thiamine-monophosphate kinase [Oceanicoccus sp.]|jgi:thiamine-monophosphate kinase
MVTGTKLNSEKDILSEFEIIQRYFSSIGKSQPHRSNSDSKELGYSGTDQASSIVLSGGDDCALLSLSVNHRLAISIDTLVSGTHFLENAEPADIAHRALAVAVSDLAAMGAEPVAFTLALTLPELDSHWLAQFSDGLHDSACFYGMRLIGGDTTKGPLTITIQVHGTVAENTDLRRSGARVGDKIYVSGSLGDAAVALDIMLGRLCVEDDQRRFFYNRFYRPQARIGLGRSLVRIASSAIDVSDGLLADLGHIATSSEVSAIIYTDKIPFSAEFRDLIQNNKIDRKKAEYHALTGGDDYELCFTVPVKWQAELTKCAELSGVLITEVGTIVSGNGVECLNAMGQSVEFDTKGYQHF